MYIFSHWPLPCQFLIFQLYPKPKLLKDGYEPSPFLHTSLQMLPEKTSQFEGKLGPLCSGGRDIYLFILLDLLHRPSRGYVVHFGKLIKPLCFGIQDLTPQSPFRKISLGVNICLNVLRRNNSGQEPEFAEKYLKSQWTLIK